MSFHGLAFNYPYCDISYWISPRVESDQEMKYNE